MTPELPGDPARPFDVGFLTADVAPVGCRARERPEDFEVEERLAYAPTGDGAHLHLFVEKRGLSTEELLRRLARALDRPRAAFGYAGRKDRDAVARQWISVEGAEPARALALALPGARVLRAVPHPRKLRRGRLAANRFRLVLRDVAPAARPRVESVLARLAAHGLPNAFGPQRFGAAGRAFELGRRLVAGELEAYAQELCAPPHAEERPALAELRAALSSGSRSALRRVARDLPPELARLARQLERRRGDLRGAVRALGGDLLSMHLSALQSLVFNRVLARRLAQGPAALGTLCAGDLAWEHASGRTRPPAEAEQLAELAARAAAFELSPSGPLPGARAPLAAGEPGRVERALCAAEGALPEAFAALGLGVAAPGARRPLRVPLAELELAFEADRCRLAFTLPAGSFATAVLAEIRKDRP